MSISSALKKTVSGIVGFASGVTRASLGLGPGKPPKEQDPENKQLGDNLASNQTLGMIYQKLVTTRQEELNRRFDDKDAEYRRRKIEDDRNTEIIKALTIKRKPTKRAPTPSKPEPSKPAPSKPTEPTPSKPAPSKPEVTKPAETKPSAPPSKVTEPVVTKPTAPPSKVTEPVVTKPTAPPSKPSTTKVETPQLPKPSAEKVTPSIPKPATTAGKIAAGAAVGATGIFATKESFSGTMMPFAEQASKALGGKIPPVAILGQWFGESGGGKSLPADFNYAGIKAGPKDQKGSYVLTEERYNAKQLERAEKSGETLERVLGPNDKMIKYQNGQKVEKTVDEWFGKGEYAKAESQGLKWVQVKSYFAKFNDFQDFTNKYISFLKAPRYSKALEATTPSEFGFEVAKAGYATAGADKYRDKIASFANSYTPVSSSDSVGTQVDDISKTNKDLKDSSAPQNKTNVNNIISQSTKEPDIVVRGKVDDRSPYDKKK